MTTTNIIIILGVLVVCIVLFFGYRKENFRKTIEDSGAYFSFATTIISLFMALLFGASAENIAQISNDFSKRSIPLEIERKVD